LSGARVYYAVQLGVDERRIGRIVTAGRRLKAVPVIGGVVRRRGTLITAAREQGPVRALEKGSGRRLNQIEGLLKTHVVGLSRVVIQFDAPDGRTSRGNQEGVRVGVEALNGLDRAWKRNDCLQ